MTATERGTRLVGRALIVALGLCLIAAGIALGWVTFSPRPFDPLVLPTQVIDSRIEGYTGPTVRVGEDVQVSATKCSTADEPVMVQGSLSWQSIRPPGSVVHVGSGTGERDPGCQTFQFTNPMPAEVADRSRALFAQGYTHAVWKISGVETPIGHAAAVARTWETEAFRVIP